MIESIFSTASKVLIPGLTEEGNAFVIAPDPNGLNPPTIETIPFTRAGGGSSTIQNGLVVEQAANFPAIVQRYGECQRMAFRSARENLLEKSDDFDNIAWTKSQTTVNPNAVIAPNGSLTADELLDTAINAAHFASQNITAVGALKYQSSCWFQQNTAGIHGVLRFQTSTAFDTEGAIIDLSNGSIIDHNLEVSPIVISLNNGWYKLIIQQTANASGSGQVFVSMTNQSSITSISYLGTGTNKINIWRAVLEIGAYATDSIGTDVGTVTRNADSISKSGLKASGYFSDSTGTIGGKFHTPSIVKDSAVQMFTIGSAGNRIFLYRVAATATRPSFYTDLGPQVIRHTFTQDMNKWIFAWDSSGWYFSVNGVIISSGVDVFTFPSDNISASGSGGYYEIEELLFSTIKLPEESANAYTAL